MAEPVVAPGTVVGADCVIEDNVVLGKRSRRAKPGVPEPEPLVLGDGVTVGCGAIVFAGARVGDGCVLGDQSYVRERTAIGAGTLVGRGSCVDNDVTIGARVSIQTMVYVTAFTVIEDDVFVGPGVTMTNDDTMARHDREYALRGAVLRRACRIGGGAVVTPGVEIGEEAFVAAGALVTRDVPPRSVVMGVPARFVRDVDEADLLERWR